MIHDLNMPKGHFGLTIDDSENAVDRIEQYNHRFAVLLHDMEVTDENDKVYKIDKGTLVRVIIGYDKANTGLSSKSNRSYNQIIIYGCVNNALKRFTIYLLDDYWIRKKIAEKAKDEISPDDLTAHEVTRFSAEICETLVTKDFGFVEELDEECEHLEKLYLNTVNCNASSVATGLIATPIVGSLISLIYSEVAKHGITWAMIALGVLIGVCGLITLDVITMIIAWFKCHKKCQKEWTRIDTTLSKIVSAIENKLNTQTVTSKITSITNLLTTNPKEVM